MENAKTESLGELEEKGFDTRNVECIDEHRERRSARTEPPASEKELEEYRAMLPTLRWLHENREAIELAIMYQLPTVIAGCPLASRLLGSE